MKRFELLDRGGKVLLLVEAADSADAVLYGFRHVEGFSGNLRDANTPPRDESVRKMAKSFEGLGLSEAAALNAARGRAADGLTERPVIRVPRQEATGYSSKPAPKPAAVKMTVEALASKFEGLGLSEAAALDAARGRTGGG